MLKTEETKVLRDPIHGYIHVDLKVVWDCINAKEMQRLRRIHQLGGDFQVYHTAEHSRSPTLWGFMKLCGAWFMKLISCGRY